MVKSNDTDGASDKGFDLPPAGTRRWVVRRKAQVVKAVQRGAITLKEVCARYDISEEEFESWERLIQRHGLNGLKATKVQRYRDVESIERTRSMVKDAEAEHFSKPRVY